MKYIVVKKEDKVLLMDETHKQVATFELEFELEARYLAKFMTKGVTPSHDEHLEFLAFIQDHTGI